VRHGFAITRFATVVAFAVGQWSTTYAGSSFQVVTAPSDAKQAQAQAPDDVQREQILLAPNTERLISLSRPFTKVVPSNPDVLGFLPIGDQSLVLKALKAGNSDILFFNKENLVESFEVTVDDSVVRRSAVPDREARFIGPAQPPALWRMEIHNKALLTSYTSYRCGADGCHYVDELTATEPAPLPRGWSNQTFINK
jgi:hypothetical protein